MADKKTKKSETKTASTTPKAKAKEQKVSVKDRSFVEVVVKIAKFGTYKKGDTIKMVGSTAQGCIDSGAVELKN